MRRFNPSPYSPEDPDLGDYGLTAQRTEITVVGTVKEGSSGADVATLHDALTAWNSFEAADFSQGGYNSDLLTNKFGSKTKEVVQSFQKAKGLVSSRHPNGDGIVGKNTWAALDGYPTDHVYEYSGSSSSSSSPTLKLTTSGDDSTRDEEGKKSIAAKAKDLTQKKWFWPVVAGGGVLLIGVIVLSRSGK